MLNLSLPAGFQKNIGAININLFGTALVMGRLQNKGQMNSCINIVYEENFVQW